MLTPFARLRRDSFKGWVLECDRCRIREYYLNFWAASRLLTEHLAACHPEEQEAPAP